MSDFKYLFKYIIIGDSGKAENLTSVKEWARPAST